MSWKLDSWRQFNEMWEIATDYQKISYKLKKCDLDNYINRRNSISLLLYWNNDKSRISKNKIINKEMLASIVTSIISLILIFSLSSNLNAQITMSFIVMIIEISYILKISLNYIYYLSYISSLDIMKTVHDEDRGIMSYIGKLDLDKLELLHQNKYKKKNEENPDYIESYKYFIKLNTEMLKISIEDSSDKIFFY
jgi:hypothetical protein